MVSRVVIVGAVIAAMLLWLGPFSVPHWTVVALILVVLALGIAVTAKRMRTERRLTRALWQALTRR
jgi:uncharacterized membrane protein